MKIFSWITLFALTLIAPSVAFGQEYQALAEIPGATGGNTGLTGYLEGIFMVLVGLATIAAILMLVIAGVQYMMSDAITKKEAAMGRIKGAIIGLLLVLGAWLILYTINPDILSFDDIFGPDAVDVGNAPPSPPPTRFSPSPPPPEPPPMPEPCVEDWSCDTWNACEDGVQTRNCIDQNSCGTTDNKPAEQQSCSEPPCVEDWSCEAWSTCDTSGTQTRDCYDLNSCGTSDNKPLEEQSCTPPEPEPEEPETHWCFAYDTYTTNQDLCEPDAPTNAYGQCLFEYKECYDTYSECVFYKPDWSLTCEEEPI